jgi:hypothetical protein
MPSFTSLQANEKVPAQNCVVSPFSCLCPPGTKRLTFYEQQSGGTVLQMMMCSDLQCPQGTSMRKHSKVKGTAVSFSCDPPPKGKSYK